MQEDAFGFWPQRKRDKIAREPRGETNHINKLGKVFLVFPE